MIDPDLQTVLDFWFVENDRQTWFRKDAGFDETVRRRFRGIYDQLAAVGKTDHTGTPEGCLAAIIVLDQFPRNMFRDTPQAFATDELALQYACLAIGREFDQKLDPERRMFVYMPFEHSEDIDDQDLCCRLMGRLGDPEYIDYAERHREVIRRFGRFPHRNRILGRKSTKEEVAYLAQPGSGF